MMKNKRHQSAGSLVSVLRNRRASAQHIVASLGRSSLTSPALFNSFLVEMSASCRMSRTERAKFFMSGTQASVLHAAIAPRKSLATKCGRRARVMWAFARDRPKFTNARTGETISNQNQRAYSSRQSGS